MMSGHGAVPPLISVAIPTCLRPQLVCRAVRSALSQTLQEIEVIVVIDGRDAETAAALETFDDSRLRTITPDRQLGNADARNLAVAHASAEWVAFLDDDDEWLPAKLDAQLRAARRSRHRLPIITCRMLARSEAGEFLWPRRPPADGEPLSEYFFCRRTPFTGEGMVINSAILAPRELVRAVPFRSGLERHVDPDWLLRATRVPGAGLELVAEPEPLLIWNIEQDRHRITTSRDWRYSYQYARSNRELMTRRGYAAFILHVVSSNAAAQRAGLAFPLLLWESVAHGRPAAVDVASHTANFLLPARVQHAIARWFARFHRSRLPPARPDAAPR